MRTSTLADAPLTTEDGKHLGTIAEVLFDPAEPRVVGFSVRLPRLGGAVPRKDRYVPLSLCRPGPGSVVLAARRLPSLESSERAIGCTWDETVQWRGMPVAGASGDVVGSVSDVVFEWGTGAVESVQISTGILGDAAVGKLTAPAAVVTGYRDGAVRLSCQYSDLRAEGGAAKAAAAGVTVLKEKGAVVAKRAYDAGMSAAVSVARSMKHGKGRRMLDAVKKAVSEAMREDEQD